MARFILRLLGGLMVLSAIALTLAHAPDRSVESLVARWAPPPSDFMQVKGQFVHYRDEGPRNDPVPLVLIHGTSASLHTWEGWVAALKGQHRVISFDLPAFGLTGPSSSEDYRSETYARFTLDVLDALHVQRFAVAGNSLGGEVAWRTALMAPARVDRLILVDAGGYAFQPKSVPIGFQLARIPLLNRLVDVILPRGVIEQSLQEVYGDPSRVTPALVDRYFELALREGNRHALVQRFQQMERGSDEARIAQLKLPTLILWGGRDRLIPPEYAKRFNTDIAGSRLVMFEALGHVPQEEDPAATVGEVKRFLAAAPT